MKQFLIFIVAFGLSANSYSQKLYSTKSGKISFESRSPIEDIDAINTEVESKLSPVTGQIVFTLLIKGFQFENQLMEDHFNDDYMHSSKYPKADFKGTITNIKTINFAKNGTYPATVTGNLTIHGVTKPVTSTGTITVKDGKVSAKSTFKIKVREYKIGGTTIGKEIAESIAIIVNCQY